MQDDRGVIAQKNQEIRQLRENLKEEKEKRAPLNLEEKKKEEIKQLEKSLQDERKALKILRIERKKTQNNGRKRHRKF